MNEDDDLDFTLDFTEPAAPVQPVLLFLDIDGVLHPTGSPPEERLTRADLLADCLDHAGAVEVVISSTWQEGLSLREIRDMLPPALADRVVGGTLEADPEREEETRFRQIRRYLSEKGLAGRPWLALDDAREEFPGNCPQLLACDSQQAFDADLAGQLSTLLVLAAKDPATFS